MKLLAGIALFLLCGSIGESKIRRLQRREQTLLKLQDLIRQIGDRQLNELVSFREGALGCPPCWEREQLLKLSDDDTHYMPLLTAEEATRLAAYAHAESRTVSMLRQDRDALLSLLQQDRDSVQEELKRKGQVYRSVGYLSGVAALLLVL